MHEPAERLTSELLADGALRVEHRCACAGGLLSGGLLDEISNCTFGEPWLHAGVARPQRTFLGLLSS